MRQCLEAAEVILAKEPGHPYASDVAANCNVSAADSARARGQDPEPFLRKSLSLLEPTVQKYPHFAQIALEPSERQTAARAAMHALAQAVTNDPLLAHSHIPQMQAALALASGP